jgi:hypothetical protein
VDISAISDIPVKVSVRGCIRCHDPDYLRAYIATHSRWLLLRCKVNRSCKSTNFHKPVIISTSTWWLCRHGPHYAMRVYNNIGEMSQIGCNLWMIYQSSQLERLVLTDGHIFLESKCVQVYGKIIKDRISWTLMVIGQINTETTVTARWQYTCCWSFHRQDRQVEQRTY